MRKCLIRMSTCFYLCFFSCVGPSWLKDMLMILFFTHHLLTRNVLPLNVHVVKVKHESVWISSSHSKGTRIIYDRKFLLGCRSSPVAKTPPRGLPDIPGVTIPPSKDSSEKHRQGELLNNNNITAADRNNTGMFTCSQHKWQAEEGSLCTHRISNPADALGLIPCMLKSHDPGVIGALHLLQFVCGISQKNFCIKSAMNLLLLLLLHTGWVYPACI